MNTNVRFCVGLVFFCALFISSAAEAAGEDHSLVSSYEYSHGFVQTAANNIGDGDAFVSGKVLGEQTSARQIELTATIAALLEEIERLRALLVAKQVSNLVPNQEYYDRQSRTNFNYTSPEELHFMSIEDDSLSNFMHGFELHSEIEGELTPVGLVGLIDEPNQIGWLFVKAGFAQGVNDLAEELATDYGIDLVTDDSVMDIGDLRVERSALTYEGNDAFGVLTSTTFIRDDVMFAVGAFYSDVPALSNLGGFPDRAEAQDLTVSLLKHIEINEQKLRSILEEKGS